MMESELIVKRALEAYEKLQALAIHHGMAVEDTIDAPPETLRQFIADAIHMPEHPARTSCPHPLGPMPAWVREVWKDPLTPQRRATD